MTDRDTYLIVTHVPTSRRDQPGRHRWNPRATQHETRAGSAGAVRPTLPPLRLRRGRHRRRPDRPVLTVARQIGALATLAAVAVSGWFTATGATALAQMTHP